MWLIVAEGERSARWAVRSLQEEDFVEHLLRVLQLLDSRVGENGHAIVLRTGLIIVLVHWHGSTVGQVDDAILQSSR